MHMTLVQRRISTETVQVTVALNIVYPDSLAAADDYIQWPVVMRSILFL
jgi:hypothetical protein